MKKNPSIQAYHELQEAFNFFNKKLFAGDLPDLLITLQRGKNTYGYFSPVRFTGESELSELALNPDYFGRRTLVDTLSTIAHEMTHAWQYYLADKCRLGYHDKIWGKKMQEIGLMPSSTGLPGGKKTGQQMSHYVMTGGKFQQAVYDLIKEGFAISWYDKLAPGIIPVSRINSQVLTDWLTITDEQDKNLIDRLTLTVNRSKPEILPDLPAVPADPASVRPPPKGTGTRQKFSCKLCGLNAWAKPGAHLVCGKCRISLE